MTADSAAQARDLDLQALAALVAVIDEGSFTRAARRLKISQPAVSLAIQRLEERAGVPLLIRTRSRTVPTQPGERLASGARLAFDSINEALAQIAHQQLEPSGRVVLGCHESLAAYALPPFMASFLPAHPKVEIRLWNGTSAQVEREVIDGRVDFGLVVNPSGHPDTVVTPLFEDSVELFHCLKVAGKTPSALVAGWPLIYVPELVQSRDLLTRLSDKRIKPAQHVPCSSLELVKNLVLDGVGVGILPERVARHGTGKRLRSLSPPLPRYRDRIAMVRRPDAARTAAMRAVLDALVAHGRAMGRPGTG